MTQILIVDDEQNFTSAISEYLEIQGHTVTSANTLSAARSALAEDVPEVLLLDLMLPDGSGLELFEQFESNRPEKIVIVTGHSGVKSLIGEMVGEGVLYMQKPIEPRELTGMLNMLSESAGNSVEPEDSAPFGMLIGESDAMQDVYKAIRRVANTDSTVLITGESGTGKELVADAIHRLSRRSGPFVPVNCGGLTHELIASQLFGHEKGSFTGANQKHIGFFERSANGTLFLDEITEMPLDMQTHLLRVLETGKIARLGSTEEITIATRLVAATNRDPVAAVRDEALREDLYFRLSVFPIALPPLRDRADDVRVLADHFLDELNKKNDSSRRFSDDAYETLQRHTWPGNVRELKHVIHRAYLMSDCDTVTLRDAIVDSPLGEIEGLQAGRTIADVERDLIFATLKQLNGDKKAAAASLGISLKTLYNRLNDYENDQS